MDKIVMTKNGLKFIFTTQNGKTSVKVLTKGGAELNINYPVQEIISVELGERLKFNYNAGMYVGEYVSLTPIVAIE